MNMQTIIAALAAPETFWLGTRYRIAVAAAGRGQSLGSFFAAVPAGEGPPLHVHHGEDEAIHVIEGAADFWLDGSVTRLTAGQGIFLPRGVPHTFRVTPEAPARFLGVVTPGGFEGFFAAAAAAGAGPHDPAGLAALGETWRVAFLGPSPIPR
jgi:mannose-6-phosphate isomerase-like protein (cupin superfamily)